MVRKGIEKKEIMKFRKQGFTDVRVVEAYRSEDLEAKIKVLAKDHIIIDLQFATMLNCGYYALALLRDRAKK